MLIKEHTIHKNYLITTNGDVISKNYRRKGVPRLLKNSKDRYGYIHVVIKQKPRRVHRLVAQTFIPNPENKPFINHIDGVKANNNINNLEWVTQSENELHAHKIGLKKGIMLGRIGSLSHLSKKVKQIDIKTGKTIKIWDCVIEATTSLNLCSSGISRACSNELKQSGGYIWRYSD
jgi:hypothetical protein